MALRVWLPLNGNLENKGISNVIATNTGATVSTPGKIGNNCYSFNGSSNWIKLQPAILTNSTPEFSVCCWFKTNSVTSAECLFSQRNAGNANGFSVFVYGTSGRILLDDGVRWDTTPRALTAGTWYHLAFTRSQSGKAYYINGELVASTTTKGTPTTAETTNFMAFGSGHNSATGVSANWVNGSLNDWRLYDHCLSQKEVKEISQALILHYKLDNAYIESTTNLLPQTKTYSINNAPSWDVEKNGTPMYTPTGWSSGYNGGVPDPTTGYHMHWIFDENNKLIMYSPNKNSEIGRAGRWMGISASIGSLPTLGFSAGCNYTLSWMQKTSNLNLGAHGGLYYKLTSGASSAFNDGQPRRYNTKVDIWEKMEINFTMSSSYDGNTSSGTIYMYGESASAEGNLYLKDIQLELKDHATPFVEGKTTRTGNKIVDSSGYENNGIAINSFQSVIDNDSRYKVCTTFNGSNTYINAGTTAKVKDEITVAWWGYMDTWSSYTRAISCTEGGGWNFEPSSGKLNFAMGTGETSNTYKSCTSNKTLASLTSGWHHFVGTYDGLASNLYIDGALDKTLSCYTTKTPIYYHPSNSIIVGAEANAGATAAGSYFNGKLTDIRIYATAISAEDVLTLYHTPLQIDNLGNFHGFEFIEDESKYSIQQKGRINSLYYLFENSYIKYLKYDTTIYSEPDGSKWIRVFHHNDPTTSGYFVKTDDWEHGVYYDTNKWYNIEELIPTMLKYEFMVKQKTTSSANEVKYRWIQNINPLEAVYNDVKPGTVTYNTSSGYTNSTMGGLWRMNGSARMCIANTNSSNWYGALGSWSPYQTNQVPGFPNSNISTGYIDLYIRIYPPAKIVKELGISSNTFIEK